MLGFKHLDTLTTAMNLAIALQKSGQVEEAIRMYRENLKLKQEMLGPKHHS